MKKTYILMTLVLLVVAVFVFFSPVEDKESKQLSNVIPPTVSVATDIKEAEDTATVVESAPAFSPPVDEVEEEPIDELQGFKRNQVGKYAHLRNWEQGENNCKSLAAQKAGREDFPEFDQLFEQCMNHLGFKLKPEGY